MNMTVRSIIENITHIHPIWPIRIGLGSMYVYSGLSLIRHPEYWYGFAPVWFEDLIAQVGLSMNGYLALQGTGELGIAALFFAWFVGKWGLRIAAALSSFQIVSILMLVGVSLTTFRDVGILGGSLAALLISFSYGKKDY